MMIFEHDNIVLRDIPEKLLNTFEDVLHLDFASRQVTDYEDFTETYNGDDVKQWCPQIPRLSGHELYNKTHIKGKRQKRQETKRQMQVQLRVGWR